MTLRPVPTAGTSRAGDDGVPGARHCATMSSRFLQRRSQSPASQCPLQTVGIESHSFHFSINSFRGLPLKVYDTSGTVRNARKVNTVPLTGGFAASLQGQHARPDRQHSGQRSEGFGSIPGSACGSVAFCGARRFSSPKFFVNKILGLD